MQQYFVAGQAQDVVIITDKDTIKHMFNVMRLTENDEVVLVFDDHVKRLAKVIDSAEHRFEIIEELDSNVELPIEVTIAAGFPKSDKLEFLAQKGTELGMAKLWAFPADWSVVKWDGKKLAKKADKLAKITLGAAKQSKRNVIPEVTLFEKKAAFLEELEQFDRIFIAYEESGKEGETAILARELSQMKAGEKILFIFGPEGGISPEEIETFESKGGLKIGLGPRIMRAETAPLYALASISYALELMK
ncbi:16S rRNA (uracil(1498)-N(3))-methyltransferase [Streptococcus macedonicus]|uniref:16S rRNA (uracil(1498)-N(3))-methyltransferase n=1 Tax=Streptococcus macedonicus TaxID=59310 RepID=UPI000C124205|nr:16S rRNA (uracil(1498)-N(3))-methyltransferase [Streptococcus macedonicus]MCW8643863.1 16S rRNA (uracil(1498)-N(3))-methyltransferase [Streptococcus macedonicus]PHV60083.1 16S rRNA (uracil(1498)-N(3))-methyltransferase [Streptococcus macedonicus]